ncbi:MAG TPA: PsiF family protein [Burkholderiales bacterium]|nr:PsiF family protein [Burkholderiales bacterium]
MKKIILLLSLSMLALPALADTAQQDKMKTCNADAKAKNLSGDARKAFMKECLGAKPAAAAEPEKKLTPQQEKMKTCNADAKAKALKGDERKKFMSECLKAK